MITLVDDNNVLERVPEIKADIDQMKQSFGAHIIISHEKTLDVISFSQHDLFLVSYSSWKLYAETKPAWLKDIPTALIIRP